MANTSVSSAQFEDVQRAWKICSAEVRDFKVGAKSSRKDRCQGQTLVIKKLFRTRNSLDKILLIFEFVI